MLSKNETTIKALPGRQELFIIREFDAPRELVYRAFTEADLLVQWLGPKNLTMKVDTFNPVNGGAWRYIHSDANGNEYGFHGVFHELQAPERIIQTFEFEGLPEKGHVELDTALFESLPGGRSKVTIQAVYQSVDDRDGMVRSGMEGGVKEGHERLDALLAKQQAN